MNSKSPLNPFALTVAVLAISQGALAADPVVTPVKVKPDQAVSKFGQLDELRSQNAILAETVKNKELREKLGMTRNAEKHAGPSTYRAADVQLAAHVLMVSGVGKSLTALLALPDGRQVNVHVGSSIPGLGIVSAIASDEVVVRGKTQTFSLPFASDASPNSQSTRTQFAPTVPPLRELMPGSGQ